MADFSAIGAEGNSSISSSSMARCAVALATRATHSHFRGESNPATFLTTISSVDLTDRATRGPR
jgi:hypothetical protein